MTFTREITTEFNNIEKMRIFEIPVIDRRTDEMEYIIFDISIDGNKLIAQHEALNSDENKSNFISFKFTEFDDAFSLDEHLEALYDECINAILDSEYFIYIDLSE